MTGPPNPEQALVEAARGGDRAALDRLLRDHQGRIHAITELYGNGSIADIKESVGHQQSPDAL